MVNDQLRDVVIVLSEVERDDKDQPYTTSFVFRFDFQGTVEDLRKVFEQHPALFIEGGMMRNKP